jgi:hypothetical protein
MKLLVVFTLLFSFGAAPFQCGTEPEPELALEDSPSEALWILAERFRSEGHAEARMTTLRQLTEQYPTSREAERARLVLDGREVAPDEPTSGGTASNMTPTTASP